ncbi:hypothetical protein D3C86_1522060 [compost metagenome]
MNHVVKLRHFTVCIGQNREIHRGRLGVVDIANPAFMGLHAVHGQGDGLDIAALELALQLGRQAQFGGADRGVVRRV